MTKKSKSSGTDQEVSEAMAALTELFSSDAFREACDEAENGPHLTPEDLEAHYHDELGTEENKAVIEHLLLCKKCREEYIRTTSLPGDTEENEEDDDDESAPYDRYVTRLEGLVIGPFRFIAADDYHDREDEYKKAVGMKSLKSMERLIFPMGDDSTVFPVETKSEYVIEAEVNIFDATERFGTGARFTFLKHEQLPELAKRFFEAANDPIYYLLLTRLEDGTIQAQVDTLNEDRTIRIIPADKAERILIGIGKNLQSLENVRIRIQNAVTGSSEAHDPGVLWVRYRRSEPGAE